MSFFKDFWATIIGKCLIGSFCIWWSYDLYTHPGQCDMGHRLTALVLKEICMELDYRVAALIPIIMLVAIIVALNKSNKNDT